MIVIIGGSSGIGLTLANHFLNRGHKVINGSRSSVTLSKENFEHHTLDVTDETSVQKFFSHPNLHHITGLVYCTGITSKQVSIKNINLDIFKKAMDINAYGFVLVMKYAFNFLVPNKSRILTIGTTATRSTSKFSGVEYTASKLALAGIVRHFALELAENRILVNSILPGPVDTPMLRKCLSDAEIENLSQDVPISKLCDTATICGLAEFLLSSENSHITGSGIDVNGGQFLTA